VLVNVLTGFGDTNAVHVSAADGPLGYRIDHLVEGDTVKEVLDYVQFDRQRLVQKLRRAVEHAIEDGHIVFEEGARLMDSYTRGLEGYTYLESGPLKTSGR
jgi:arginine decarboxylase